MINPFGHYTADAPGGDVWSHEFFGLGFPGGPGPTCAEQALQFDRMSVKLTPITHKTRLTVYYPPHIKSLLPSLQASGNAVELSSDDFRKLLSHFLRGIEVDENWYLEAYPDVGVAIGDGHVASAKAHYVSAGYMEGRFPCRPNIDGKSYLERYEDLAAAYDAGTLEDPENHFLHVGYKESRVGTNFPVDEAWYLETYNVQLSAELPSAKQHFDRVGYNLGFRPFPLDV